MANGIERELALVELLAEVRHEGAQRLLGLRAQPFVDEHERALGVAAREGEPRRRVAPVVLRLTRDVLRQRQAGSGLASRRRCRAGCARRARRASARRGAAPLGGVERVALPPAHLLAPRRPLVDLYERAAEDVERLLLGQDRADGLGEAKMPQRVVAVVAVEVTEEQHFGATVDAEGVRRGCAARGSCPCDAPPTTMGNVERSTRSFSPTAKASTWRGRFLWAGRYGALPPALSPDAGGEPLLPPGTALPAGCAFFICSGVQ